jgi:hypothetical protein
VLSNEVRRDEPAVLINEVRHDEPAVLTG